MQLVKWVVQKIIFHGTRYTVGEMVGIENYISWEKKCCW